jgi:D-psicose/D-tagatose/L-ribulose 3-epimerase
MDLALGENAWWGTSVDRVSGVRLAKEAGYDSYSIFTSDMTPEIRRGMRESMRDLDFPCSSFTVVGYSLADWNSDIRKMTLSWVKKQVDIGYDFGGKKMILVPGEYSWDKQEIDPKVQWGWTVDAVREIADYAKSLNIEVALEFETPRLSIINSIDTVVQLIEDVNHPALKANVDFVHMYVVGDKPESLKKLRGKIINVHIADSSAGKHGHMPPGRGDVPLLEYLRVLKEIGFDDTIAVEIEWSNQPGRILEWIEESYCETDKLMKQIGAR